MIDLEDDLARSLQDRSTRARITEELQAIDSIATRAVRIRRRRHRSVLVAAVLPVLLVGALIVVRRLGEPTTQSVETMTSPSPVPAVAVPSDPPTIAMFGDSTALMTNWGMAPGLLASGRARPVEGQAFLGCALMEVPERRIAGEVDKTDPSCTDWPKRWQELVDKGRPDISVVETGVWDIADVQLLDDGVWRGPGDPVFDARLQAEATKAVDILTSRGGVVIFLTQPSVTPVPGSEGRDGWNGDERLAHFNDLLWQLPGLRPGKVAVVDLAGWFASLSAEENARLRPDGVHLTEQTSPEVCSRFLCEAVIEAAAGLR